MPIYEFECPECGHKFEIITSADKREGVKCEICGARAERVWKNQFSFHKSGCSGNCAGCSGCKSEVGHG